MVMSTVWLVILWGSKTDAKITRSGTLRGNDYERYLPEEETANYEYYSSKGSKGGYYDSKKAKSCKSNKKSKKGYYGYYDQ